MTYLLTILGIYLVFAFQKVDDTSVSPAVTDQTTSEVSPKKRHADNDSIPEDMPQKIQKTS